MTENHRQSNTRPILRSQLQTTSCYSISSAFASSTITARSSQILLHRSTSPTRVSVFSSNSPPAHSIRFTYDRRENSPNRNLAMSRKPAGPAQTKRTCSCSPTNHPGSFRCSLHKQRGGNNNDNNGNNFVSARTTSLGWNKLERSAMVNSLVRIGAVEGDLVKRALAALIRPSSHQLRRRHHFQRRLSRLSFMSTA